MSAKLDRAEWDFSAVPDDELKWCFLWEYKRETAPAQNKHAFAYCPETAWQNLDGLSKMGVQSRFMENWDDRPGDVEPVRELQPDERLDSIGDTKLYHSGAADVWFTLHGRLRVALEINFRDFRNEQIVADLEQRIAFWRMVMIELEVPAFRPPPGKGIKLQDYRCRLQGLGIMRLRHVMDVPEIIELFEDRAEKPWPASARTVPEIRDAIGKLRERVAKWHLELFPDRARNLRPTRWAPLL